VLAGIARLCSSSSFEQAVNSVSEALLYGVSDLDSLIAIHNRLTGLIPDMAPVHLPQDIPALTPCEPDISKYDAILMKKGWPVMLTEEIAACCKALKVKPQHGR
jgi:hypothetical protein